MTASDVVIVGGGVIGGAIAYFLGAEAGFKGSVTVVEPAPIPMWSLLVLACLLVVVTARRRLQHRILAGWSEPWP